MKRKLLSLIICLAMVMMFVPCMGSAAPTELLTETLVYNYRSTTGGKNFSVLTIDNYDQYGWFVKDNKTISITSYDEDMVIKDVELEVTARGENYPYVVYSSGEKVETNAVSNFSEVHVKDINSNSLTISCQGGNDGCSFYKVEIHYYYEHHHKYGAYPTDNGDGTHSYKCMKCGELGEPENHSFEPCKCACGVAIHDFTGEYKDNGGGTHSRKCIKCNEYSKPESHTFENCKCICGAIHHDLSGEYINNGNGTHSQKCTNCKDYYPTPHTFEATDKGDGMHIQRCTLCGDYSIVNHSYISGKCICGKTVLHESLIYNNSNDAESEHFTLHKDGYLSSFGWRVDDDECLTITTKDSAYTIVGVDISIYSNGDNYSNVVYSSGEKVETGDLDNKAIVHVKNINSDNLKITVQSGYIYFTDITVYYLHPHDFSGVGRDNGDGTHSQKCTKCDEYGTPSSHRYRPIEKVSDNPLTYTARCTICSNETDSYKIPSESFDHTGSTTYEDVGKGETLKDGTQLKATYLLGDAKMIVYLDDKMVADVNAGEYWTAPQCVRCLNYNSHWGTSYPLEIWFETICDYTYATCETPETCVYCGHTNGEALGHKWQAATIYAPKTCSVCGHTEGEPIGGWDKVIVTAGEAEGELNLMSLINKSVIVLEAEYNKDGKMLQADYKNLDLVANETYKYEVNLNKYSNGNNVKVFIWDNLNVIKPLSEFIEFKVK